MTLSLYGKVAPSQALPERRLAGCNPYAGASWSLCSTPLPAHAPSLPLNPCLRGFVASGPEDLCNKRTQSAPLRKLLRVRHGAPPFGPMNALAARGRVGFLADIKGLPAVSSATPGS